jgi:hypothetical protein
MPPDSGTFLLNRMHYLRLEKHYGAVAKAEELSTLAYRRACASAQVHFGISATTARACGLWLPAPASQVLGTT